jgi:hypothetical protein
MVYLILNQDGLNVHGRFKKVLRRDPFIWVGSLTDQSKRRVRFHGCSGGGIEAQPVIARQPWTVSLLDQFSTGSLLDNDRNQAGNDSAASLGSTQRCC